MGHRYDALARPATPVEVLGVRTETEYLARQRRLLSDWARLDPTTAREPFEAGSAVVEISGWKWIVWCTCGDAPSASPAWDVARCGRCGAVYRGLGWPVEREALCAVLRVRPGRASRTWHPGETLERLRAENAARGLRDREEDP